MDEIDEMVVAVRADTAAFRRDIAALRAGLGAELVGEAERAGRAIDRALARAIVNGKLGFEDLKRLALSVMADIARAAVANGIGAATGGAGIGGGLLSLGQSLLLGLFGARDGRTGERGARIPGGRARARAVRADRERADRGRGRGSAQYRDHGECAG